MPLIEGNYKNIIEEELKDLKNRFSGVEIDYYVFMPDHLHLILFLYNSLVPLSRIIQAFKSITTLQIKRKGYSFRRFWQQNYYEHVIRNERALYKIRKYVVENPMVEKINWRELEKTNKKGEASFAATNK